MIIKKTSKTKGYFTIIAILFSGIMLNFNANASGKNNFNGSYTIDYGESRCGNLGYAFKLVHQRDGYSSTSAMRKSNCKLNANGNYEGYIYPKKRPNMRIFWIQTAQGVTYKD